MITKRLTQHLGVSALVCPTARTPSARRIWKLIRPQAPWGSPCSMERPFGIRGCRIRQNISEISPMPKKTSLPKARYSLNRKCNLSNSPSSSTPLAFDSESKIINSQVNFRTFTKMLTWVHLGHTPCSLHSANLCNVRSFSTPCV